MEGYQSGVHHRSIPERRCCNIQDVERERREEGRSREE
jgi:hypothetical protein